VRVVAAVLTHNAERHGRGDMLIAALRSLTEADATVVVDNGSTDGTADLVARIGGVVYEASDGVHTCGRGMNVTITAASEHGDLVAFSNDDIVWRPGWRATLEAFWSEAPADVAIVSGLLEDDYPWNRVVGTVDAGGVRGLVRATVPGGAWTLRSAEWPTIGPVPEAVGWDDVPTCRRLGGEGRRVVALDLADHVGVAHSTWGNGSAALGTPLDRGRWGL
jgi:glycosyltransferase involved in cell wall biosynthesis